MTGRSVSATNVGRSVTNLGWVLYFARKYDDAIKQYQIAIEHDPDLFRPHRLLGLVYLQKNQPEQAIAAIQHSVALSRESPEEKAYLGYAYGVTGQRAEALKVLGELQEEAKHKYISAYLMALVSMGLGKKIRLLSS